MFFFLFFFFHVLPFEWSLFFNTFQLRKVTLRKFYPRQGLLYKSSVVTHTGIHIIIQYVYCRLTSFLTPCSTWPHSDHAQGSALQYRYVSYLARDFQLFDTKVWWKQTMCETKGTANNAKPMADWVWYRRKVRVFISVLFSAFPSLCSIFAFSSKKSSMPKLAAFRTHFRRRQIDVIGTTVTIL